MDQLALMATFVRVVETGSLSKAARATGLSLPAVSRQLKSLEQDLGATLIVRTTRRLEITDDGRQWYDDCARILRDLDEARGKIGEGDVRGSLVVSVPVTLGLHCVVPRLPRILEAHPRLSIDLRLEDNLVDLVGDGVDVVIRAGAPLADSPDLLARPLLQFRRVVVASPAYLRKHGRPRDPTALAGHRCLVQLVGRGPLATWELEREGDSRSVAVSGHLRATAPLALLDAAKRGLGIALLPEWLIRDDVEAGRLKLVFKDWRSRPISAWAVHRIELKRSPRVRAFIDGVASAV